MSETVTMEDQFKTIRANLNTLRQLHDDRRESMAKEIIHQSRLWHKALLAEKKANIARMELDEGSPDYVLMRNTLDGGIRSHRRTAEMHRYTLITVVQLARQSGSFTQAEIDACYHRGREDAGNKPLEIFHHCPGNDGPF